MKIKHTFSGVAGFTAAIGFLALIIAPYINHIIWCIDAADRTGSAIALLIVGIVVAPIGWLHGLMAFFGYGWV